VARSAAVPAYEETGPPPAGPRGPPRAEGGESRGSAESNRKIRSKVESRMLGLDRNRLSWWDHWRALASYQLPRRYKWLVTANEATRGSAINNKIVDSTSMLAARTLTSGLLSGLTNPATPWFKFEIDGFSNPGSDVVLWLAECQRRMSTVFQESNFYNSMAVMYFDLVVFGTASVLIYDDFDDVIRCFNPCLGEYYVDVDNKHRVVVFYRKFVMTIAQTVAEFGEENCSDSVKRLYNEGGTALTQEIIIAHALEPNDDGLYGVPKRFKFRECCWVGALARLLLRKGLSRIPRLCRALGRGRKRPLRTKSWHGRARRRQATAERNDPQGERDRQNGQSAVERRHPTEEPAGEPSARRDHLRERLRAGPAWA
jgi:hypothetical protein